ncbi:MAG TPA: hypothetical protein EYH34_15690 [Planctomycetes bacterium]|nr:hypothetical protein [Planctomycetota bacterium]
MVDKVECGDGIRCGSAGPFLFDKDEGHGGPAESRRAGHVWCKRGLTLARRKANLCSARRRLWRSGCLLGILVALFFALGSGAGWVVRRSRQAARQRDAMARIRSLGGVAYYDYQYRRDGGGERLERAERRPAPAWLYKLVGPDLLHRVFYVNFALFRRGDRESRQPILVDEVTDREMAILEDLPGLRWLSLNGTRVTDAGLGELARFAHLERLWLSGTQVGDRGLWHLRNMRWLRQLYLNGTRVTDAGLAHLAGLDQLEKLWLTGPQITDAGLAHVGKLTRLDLLFLDGTGQSDTGMQHLRGLRRLEWLRISRCGRITDAGLEPLSTLRRLRELDLSHCPRLTDAGLVHLRRLRAVRALSLRGTGVTDSGLEQLRNMTQLSILHLEQTRCSLSGVVHLFTELQGRDVREALAAVGRSEQDSAGRLVALDLTGVRVTDRGLSHLKGCSRLEWLFLQGSEVTDEGLRELAGLKSLKLLHLAHTRVTDRGLKHLASLSHLQTLHLAGTAVTKEAVRDLQEGSAGRLRVYLIDFSQYGYVAPPGASTRKTRAPRSSLPP